MKKKHKVIKEFQFLTTDKKIIILKVGTVLEDYVFKAKDQVIPIDKDIIENNTLFFDEVDWKADLIAYMKVNKMPQPAQLGKKLIPFIDEMLSSVQTESPTIDPDKLDKRECDLKDREDEILVRLSRLEKREQDYKDDLKSLDKKEDDLREKSRELINKSLEIDDKIQDINERERTLDLNILKSSEEIDSKYTELQSKINSDLKSLSDKEKELENKLKELSKRESKLDKRESEINDKVRNHELSLEDFERYKQEVIKLDSEIKNWESMHWKFRRNEIPPSAIPDSKK
jgi:uncharacterized phage infection (PIP) family protein YhgE